MRLLTFSKYDPAYAKAYREKQRAKREAARNGGVIAPPPKPATKPPPQTKPAAAKTPQQAAVTLDRGPELPAACACAVPPPPAGDIEWHDESEFITKPFAPGANVRFRLQNNPFVVNDAQLKSVGVRDEATRRRIVDTMNALGARYGSRMSTVENSSALGAAGYKAKGENVIAYIRNGNILGINPKMLKDRPGDERNGWHPTGTANIEGTLVHEYGHYFLQSYRGGALYSGAEQQRVYTLASRAAREAGMPAGVLGSSVGQYAKTDRHEAEAELWAFYHMGGDKRPNWVIKWGETLHHELGLDPTPLCVDLGLCKIGGAAHHPQSHAEPKVEPKPTSKPTHAPQPPAPAPQPPPPKKPEPKPIEKQVPAGATNRLLREDQFAALMPKRGGWTTTTRAKTLAILKQTPEGNTLLRTLDSFQSGSSVNIPRLRTDIEKVLAGNTDTLAGGRISAVRNLLDAIAQTDAGDRFLYRGMVGEGDFASVFGRYKKGSEFDISLASFSTDKKLAAGFSLKGAGKRVTSKTTTPIFVEWVTGTRHALPIENLGKSRIFSEEREWVAAGKFKIIDVFTRTIAGNKTVVLRIEQVKTW